jgi:hypothetical protein
MRAVTTIGLDIAKSVFQVHGIDGRERDHPLAQAPVCPWVLPKAAAVRRGDRGMRNLALLVARDHGARPYRAPAAAGLREAYVKRQNNDAADHRLVADNQPILIHQ